MAIRLDDKAARSLWRFVEASRNEVEQTWKPRLDQDRDLLLGQHWSPEDTGMKKVVRNYTGNNIWIKYCSQSYRKPEFDAQPVPSAPAAFDQPDQDPQETRRQSILIGAYLTQDFADSGAWSAAQSCLYDARWAGIGIAFTGWYEGDPEPLSRDVKQAYAEEYQAMAENPLVDAGSLQMPQDTVGEGAKTVRISPYDFIVDPTVDAFNWQEADYIGRIFTVPKERLERDTTLKGVKDLSGTADLKGMGKVMIDPADRDRPQAKDHPFVVLYEVWFRNVYLKGGYTDESGERFPAGYYPLRVIWAAEREGEPLKVEVWPYELRDNVGRRLYPFDLLINRPVPGKLKGQSDAEIGEQSQKSLNLARAMEATYADYISRVKYMIDSKNVSPESVNALTSNIVGAIVEVNNPGENPIVPIAMPAVKPEVEMTAEHAMRDLNALTGVSEAAQGVVTEGAKRTATEITNIAAQGSTRASKDDEEWEEFLSSIADKRWQLKLQYQKTGDRVNVTYPKALSPQLPPGPGMGIQPDMPQPMNAPMAGPNPGPLPPAPGPGYQGPTTEILSPDHLLPVQVSVVTGSTKLRNEQQDIQNNIQALTLLAQVGLLCTVQNPVGLVPARPLVEGMLKAMGIDNGNPDLWDTTEIQQQAQAMQFQQMQMAAQAQMQAQMQALAEHGGLPQGGIGGPSPAGLPGAASSPGEPFPPAEGPLF